MAALRTTASGPVQGLVLGIGTIGRHAVEAVSNFGSTARRDAYLAAGFRGVVVHAIGRNVTEDERTMLELLASADVLVDASQRDDPSRPLVPNRWLDVMPPHAVISDLVVDPYLLDTTPPTVRSIEGIPRGNLDRLRVRSRRCDLDRYDPRRDPHGASTSCRVVLLVARRSSASVYGALRRAAGVVAAGASRAWRRDGFAARRPARGTRAASRVAPHVAGHRRGRTPRRPGRAPADLTVQPRRVGP